MVVHAVYLPRLSSLILGALLLTRDVLARLLGTRRWWRWAAGAALLAVSLSLAFYHTHHFEILRFGGGEAVHALSCRWADAQMPARVVVVSSEMSGALKFYTNRSVVRWDWVLPDAWPTLRRRVQGGGATNFTLY